MAGKDGTHMRIIGVILLALDIIGLAYGGIRWTHQEKVVDIGPIEVTHDKTEKLPLPPIAGALCLAAGVAIIISSSRKRLV
jgi:hypothetical protein